MDAELLDYYEAELRHLRDMAGEFAAEFPKVAGRLDLSRQECADPYVERLLEGFAYLAARVHLKMDAEFPQFTEELLGVIYPDYLAPLPTAAVVELVPDSRETSAASGFHVKRGTVLKSTPPLGEATPCVFRLAHGVDIYPLVVESCEYLPSASALAARGINPPPGTRCGVRLRLMATGGLTIAELEIARLKLFLRGVEGTAGKLFEVLVRAPTGISVVDVASGQVLGTQASSELVVPLGYADDEALLPEAPASFEGYRLLREYFMIPERFLFVEVSGFERFFKQISGDSADLVLLCGAVMPEIENLVDEKNISLYAAPVVNLFAKHADRVNVTGGERELHVVVDRVCPLDYEIFRVERVRGHLEDEAREQEFTALYRAPMIDRYDTGAARHFSVKRQARRISSAQRRRGGRSNYVGSEVFLMLTDSSAPPADARLRQLSVEALCTNRDLPMLLSFANGQSELTLESAAPVEAVKVLVGPTRPRAAQAFGESTWRLINHLSLNYLSISDEGLEGAALPLRRLLTLYADMSEDHVRRMIESIRSVTSRPVVRRIRPVMPESRVERLVNPLVAARGLEISVTCDESGFAGTGLFLFSAMLERFFAKYASINSFTETVIYNSIGQEIVRWPARTGIRRLL